jgi:BirA family transcriptional regulator, biotin operon repressor / biotin---[acetyl-CoA-carboxylase] ligase
LKLPAGHRVVHFERIDSTNSEARRLAEAGERGPLWIWSDEQTGGRGRQGRAWVSEPGNLYVTCLFQTAAPASAAAQISFVAAIAVHELVSGLLPKAGFFLKWPNDVLMGSAKFCGLLAEVVDTSPTRIALGCGINLAHAPSNTPYPVAALGSQFTPDSVLQKLAVSLWHWLEIWDEGRGFPAIRSAWLERAAGVGKEVFVEGMAGRFEGLSADGALLMTLADGTQRQIHAGEVRFATIEHMRSGKK